MVVTVPKQHTGHEFHKSQNIYIYRYIYIYIYIQLIATCVQLLTAGTRLGVAADAATIAANAV